MGNQSEENWLKGIAALKKEELKWIVSDRGWNNGLILSCESYRATLVESQNSNGGKKQNRSFLKQKQHILPCTATRGMLGRMYQLLKTSQRSLALYYRKAACNETDSDKFDIDG